MYGHTYLCIRVEYHEITSFAIAPEQVSNGDYLPCCLQNNLYTDSVFVKYTYDPHFKYSGRCSGIVKITVNNMN